MPKRGEETEGASQDAAATDADYFSSIPDVLIAIIITFLPFKEAVRTSILSRRWRNLWHSTRNVNLDENFFPQKTEFVKFITRWLESYDEFTLERFSLVISNPPEIYHSEIHRCVKFVLERRHVKALDLVFSDPSWDGDDDLDAMPQTSLHLPVTLDGRHTMLESLGLSACKFVVPNLNSFLAIRNLFLGWMKMPGSSLNNFLSMCPFLEILILNRCWNLGNLDVDAPRLRVLILDKCSGPEFISVNAPLLTFFKYYGLSVYLQMEDHWRLVQAEFDFRLQQQWDDEGDPEMLYNLLVEIGSVKSLTVCSYMLQMLPMAENSFMLKPSLANVTHLYLKTRLDIQEFYGITFFLNSCPNLEALAIEVCPTRIFEDVRPPYLVEEHPFASHLWYPVCVEEALKTVEIKGFKGDANEILVLRFLLKFGKELEKLCIYLSEEGTANGMDFQSLLECDVRSPNLRVYLYCD